VDQVENMREAIARLRHRLCQCEWFNGHLCAVRPPCVVHTADELDYTIRRHGPVAIQLRLF